MPLKFESRKSQLLAIVISVLIIAIIINLTSKQSEENDCKDVNFIKYGGDEASPPSTPEEYERQCYDFLALNSKTSQSFMDKYPDFNLKDNSCIFKKYNSEKPPKDRLGWSIGCFFECCKSRE